jgi:hypothetical protein
MHAEKRVSTAGPGKSLLMLSIPANDFASQSIGKAHEVVALTISDCKAIDCRT